MRKIQIKTSTRFITSQSQLLQTVNPGEGIGKREPSHTDAGNGNWEQPLRGTWGRFLSMKMTMKLDCSLTPYTKINCK